MKQIIILLCKFLAFIGSKMNKGSSMPGKIALKLRPNILSEIKLPDKIVAVTGSNGKTSTVEMIAATLKNSGMKVVWNKEGSNLIFGVATLLLKNSNLKGEVKADVILLECDERYTKQIFKYVKPTYFVATNLYRDQLTRNVHPFWIYNIIESALSQVNDCRMVLNGDDPISGRLGKPFKDVCYFGIDKNKYSYDEADSLYNDCYYCPECKGKMEYKYFHYTQLGAYECTSCGFKRPELKYLVNDEDFSKGEIVINNKKISIKFASKYNVYNILAAYAISAELGVDESVIIKTLSDFKMKNGRIVKFIAGDNKGLLITSKHENSTSYNQSLEYVSAVEKPSELVIIVDQISRKYYTSETSWLWDISFEKLKDSNVKKVILAGNYAYDLAVRFETIDLPQDMELIVTTDLDEMARIISEPTKLKLFVITCFSDKGKLFSRVKPISPIAK